MKTNLFFFLLTVFFTNSMFAQAYYQYFDGADTSYYSINIAIDNDSTNVWQIGRPQKTIFNAAATEPNAIVTDTLNPYPPNNTSQFMATIAEQYTPFWGVLALQWKQKLDFGDGDGGTIEYSIDEGESWHNVFENPYVYNFYGFLPENQAVLPNDSLGFMGVDTTWRDVWLCFSADWVNSSGYLVWFRFTSMSDSTANDHEGWMLDNMQWHVTIVHTVSEIKQEKYLNVYPNPANTIVYIETQKQQGFHIIEEMKLTDATGRVVATWQNIPTKFFINTEKYANGSYYLNIKTNLKSETIPLVIQH